MRMGKKLLAALLCLAVLAAGCGLAALADTTGVSYIEYSWDAENQKLVRQDRTVTGYTVLTGDESVLLTGWYVAKAV